MLTPEFRLRHAVISPEDFSKKETPVRVSAYDSHEKALVKGRRGDLGFPLHLTLIRTL